MEKKVLIGAVPNELFSPPGLFAAYVLMKGNSEFETVLYSSFVLEEHLEIRQKTEKSLEQVFQ